jgi:hypothetical protein
MLESLLLLAEDVFGLHLFSLNQSALVLPALLQDHLGHWGPVEYLSAHDSIEDAVYLHHEARTHFVKVDFILVLIDCLSENLVISEADCLFLAGEVKHMVDHTRTLGVVLRHIEGSHQQLSQQSQLSSLETSVER